MQVSVVIMTKNEELRLSACLQSLTGFDDVFVVDSASSDRTIEIAQNAGAHFVNFIWDGQYPKKKQWCFDSLPFKHDWVLYVDADERLTPELADELRALHPAQNVNGYFIKAKPVFMNRVLNFGQPNNKIALLRRGHSAFPRLDDLDMGEVEGTYQPQVQGKVGQLRHAMLHDCNDLDSWLTRHLRYAKRDSALRSRRNGLLASSNYETMSRRFKKAVLNILPLRFLFVFLYSYVARLGFLDGSAGFHYALARSFFYWQRDLLTKNYRE